MVPYVHYLDLKVSMLGRLLIAVFLVLSAAAQPANIPKSLIQYVTDARNLGLRDTQIEDNAVRAGWPLAVVKEVTAYLGSPAPGPNAEPSAPRAAGPEGRSTPIGRSSPAETPDATSPPEVRGAPDDYRIGEGDIVQISVWRQPEVSVESAVVRPDGKVSMPLIKELPISGLTPIQAEAVIKEQLSAFISAPDVVVVVKELHSKKVYAVGEVNKPGPLPYTYRMTVLQAISEAGGLTNYAKRTKIYVLRSQDGKESRLPFNYNEVLKGVHMERNFQLQAGDTLVVPN